MKVEVHLLFPFREELGEYPLKLELPASATVAQAIAVLVSLYPQLRERFYDRQGRIGRHISALINGVSVLSKQGFATPLQDGDVLTLLPAIGGG